MAQKYLVAAGIILLLLSVVGLFVESFAGIRLQGAQLALYLVAGIVALGTAYVRRGRRRTLRWFGGVFMVLAIIGAVAPGVLTSARLDNGVAANILHLLLGMWGLWIGFLAREFKIKRASLSADGDEDSFL